MKLNKDLFNPAKFNVCSEDFQERMVNILFNNNEDYIFTKKKIMNFKRLDENLVILENKILTYLEAEEYLVQQIDTLFSKDVVYLSKEKTISGNQLRIEIKFKFKKKSEIWVIDNYASLKNVKNTKFKKRKNKGGYRFKLLGKKVKIGFGTNSVNNGKYIEKANKMTNLYDQIEYLRMLIKEELLIVL